MHIAQNEIYEWYKIFTNTTDGSIINETAVTDSEYAAYLAELEAA